MKKIMFLIVAITFGLVASAQDSTAKKMHKMGSMEHKMKDCVMMKDGKMMTMKGGKKMEMESEMTMSNGVKVSTDGTVTMKDGTTKMMEDGDCVYMDGKMEKMKMPAKKKKVE